MWMKYEGFSKILASDFLVSEHTDRNEGDFLHYCLPKFLAKGMSTEFLQKSRVNFFFPHKLRAGLWASQQRTPQHVLLHRISHLSPLPPLNKSVFDAHNLAQCQLSAAYLDNAPNEDDVGTEGVLGIISVLPAVRSLCQRHSQRGIWIDLKCKKDKRFMFTLLMWKICHTHHIFSSWYFIQLLVLYSAQ